MKYVRKLFTLPEDLVERLAKEPNQSALVAKVLGDYFEGKQATWQVVGLAQSISAQVSGLQEFMKSAQARQTTQPLSNRSIRDQLEEMGLKYDPTMKGKAWSEDHQNYLPYTVKDGKVTVTGY